MNGLLRGAAGAAFVSLALLSGCAVTEKSMQEKGLRPTGEAELRAQFARERSFRWSNVRGSGTGRTWPDGRAMVEFPGGSMPGAWRIDGGLVCSKYGDLPELCLRSYKTGAREYQYFVPGDGSWRSTVVEAD
ncbi:MAG: hypothetical protein ACLGII_03485 [Gammaproteobacteria bacterium]